MYYEINKIQFYYETIGEGIPILFLNGFANDFSIMKKNFEPFFKSDANCQRIYVDHPGVGKTKLSGTIDIEELLEGIKSFVQSVTREKEFLLVGASFGGFVARYLVDVFKERVNGLFLLYPLISHKFSEATIEKDVIDRINIVMTNKEIENEIQEEAKEAMQNTDFLFLENLITQAQEFHLEIGESSFNKPVCILTGRQDSSVGYKDAFSLIENYPKATFCVLDNASHNLHVEQKELFSIFVENWLRRVADLEVK
ncbi:MAG: alpha/beta hydrolase [Firmicutes bacterium]|nr:alpha/beta hydrolase [Bacillota bacterium]